MQCCLASISLIAAADPWSGDGWFGGADYDLARQVLQRGIAALYLVAFVAALRQFPALLGEHGLLPVRRIIGRNRAAKWRSPSLFQFHYSDRFLRLVCVLGILLALLVLAGLPQVGPPWVPLLVFLGLWVLYQSIVNVGQVFYGFGWETLLLEAGFFVAFLGSDQVPAPLPVLFLIRWLVFRVEFGAGMIKMRGDHSWRDLTALYYHHETQPMPNPLSRTAHLMPRWFHRLEVLGNHVAQLGLPWLLFAPQPVATWAAVVIILTQLWLVATGNFAWLNAVTVVIAFSAVGDTAIEGVTGLMTSPDPGRPAESSPSWWMLLVLLVTLLSVVLSYRPLLNLFSRRQLMNASFNRWHLLNAYGAFGSVTTDRHEVIIEGSDSATAADADREGSWREYEFPGKPGDPRRRPPQVA
ncbi:MAG: lipase maturation factor family protein, partial [Glaciihabitans sp.]|nr:lipase maturation factor family protein [Glaciihabitans sp.]